MGNQKNKILTILIVAIFLILTLAILLPKFPIFVVKKVFNYAVQNFVNITGLSPWLIKGILVFVLMPFYWALMEISKLNLHLFRRKRSYHKLAKFTIFSYVGLFFLAMFFLSRGTYFGHTKGEAIKYYAITPGGIRFFDSPGYDPKYGIELKPVTPDIMIKYQKRIMGMQPKKIEIVTINNTEFFDPITGDPKVWYYLDSNGNYEFFDGPGFHPVYKVELQPVTADIIQAYKKKLNEIRETEVLAQQKKIQLEKEQKQISYLNKYLNLSIQNQPAFKEAAVLIIDEDHKERDDLNRIVISYLESKNVKSLLGLFKNPFIQDGIFEKVFSGDSTKLKDLQIFKHADYVILGKISSNYKANPELQNVISSEVGLEIKVISCENSVIINSAYISEKGAGFSNADAENKAIEVMNEIIGNFLGKTFK